MFKMVLKNQHCSLCSLAISVHKQQKHFYYSPILPREGSSTIKVLLQVLCAQLTEQIHSHQHLLTSKK